VENLAKYWNWRSC